MKKIVILLTLMLITTAVFAQEMKIAYIDMNKVYNQFPDKAVAEEQFNKEAQQWEQELVQKEEEIKKLNDEYQNLPPIVTQQRKDEKKALIEKKQREYQQLAEKLRNQALQRQTELLEPISKEIVNAVNAVAEKNGFDLVLNSLQGESVIYANPDLNLDITSKVITELNKKE